MKKKELSVEETALKAASDLEKKQKAAKVLEALKRKYVVRSFKTTTESFKFIKRISKTLSSLESLDSLKDEDISVLFDVFDEKTIKYVVSTFVLKRAEQKNKELDYENEFIGDFESLMSVFLMALEFLTTKANGEGKKQAPKGQKKEIISTKRP